MLEDQQKEAEKIKKEREAADEAEATAIAAKIEK